MDRQELIDELSDAIDNRMDMDVSYSMLAEACVDRLIELGVVDFGLDQTAMAIVNEQLKPKGE
jgi:hypothetical protein